MSNTRSCEDVMKKNITPADFGIAESEHQKAIYFAEYMLHRGVAAMQAEIDGLRAKLKALEEQEPVGSVFTMEALVPGGEVKYHATISKPVPAGAKLYLAAGAPNG